MKIKEFKMRLIPVIAFTALVLLLVGAHSYTLQVGKRLDLSIQDTTKLWDLFCYYKAIAIWIISVAAGIIMTYLLITRKIKIKKTRLYIPMLIYTAGVLVSCAASEYKEMAWLGGYSRFEGTCVILCYMFMLFYTINVVDGINDAVTVLVPTMIGVSLACIVGFTQLMGRDILYSPMIKKIILRSDSLDLQADTWGVYQTVYNMNYVAMYLALVIPILVLIIVGGIFAYKKNKSACCHLSRKSLGAVILAAISLLLLVIVNIVGARSMGGVLGIMVALAVMIIVWIDKPWLRWGIIAVAALLFFGALIHVYNGGADEIASLDYIVTGNDCVYLSVDDNPLTIEYIRSVGGYNLKDEYGNYLNITESDEIDGMYQIDDDRFIGKLALASGNAPTDGSPIFYLNMSDEGFLFNFSTERVTYINPFQYEVRLDMVEKIGFKDHLKAGSTRGYIWSRTIPLIKDRLIVGSGADTFLMVFPQDDYAGKYSAGIDLDMMIDKPHNLYLMMAVCTGGVSCAAFLTLIIMFVIKSLRVGRKNPLLAAITAGVIGFATAGLVNDSTVCIMPIFYGMLGIGIALELSSNEKASKIN